MPQRRRDPRCGVGATIAHCDHMSEEQASEEENIDAVLEGLDTVLEGYEGEAVDNDEGQAGDRLEGHKKKNLVVEHLSDGIRDKTEATIFVKPIPSSVETKHDLAAQCEAFGEVVHVHICADRKFAFVHFAEVASATAALETGKLSIDGEDVEIKKAQLPEGKKHIRRRLAELALSYKENPWDSNAALLQFFENTLTPDAVDFVNSLEQTITQQLADAVVTCIENKQWNNFDGICMVIESLDHAQVESYRLPEASESKKAKRRRQMEEVAAPKQPGDPSDQWRTPGMNPEKLRAILRYLQAMGGKAPIGLVGGKHCVKGTELREAGFICKSVGTSGQSLVSAPADLMAVLDDDAMLDESAPEPISGNTRKRRQKNTKQMHSNEGYGKRQRTTESGNAAGNWKRPMVTPYESPLHRSPVNRSTFRGSPIGGRPGHQTSPGLTPPRYQQPVSTSRPQTRSVAPARPSMAPHLAQRMQQRSARPHPEAPARPYNAFSR